MNELLILAMFLFSGQQNQHQTLEGTFPSQDIVCGGGDCGPNGLSSISCQAQSNGTLVCSTIHSGGVAVVPAMKITVPASHPCNKTPMAVNGAVLAVCITGPEEHWTCEDKRRVLLTSEDDQHFCLRMDLIGEKR